MFDFEGEKLAARRLRDRTYIAEELQRQIEEKKRPVPSPDPYSTTNGDGYGVKRKGNYRNYRNYRSYEQKSARRIPFVGDLPPQQGKYQRSPRRIPSLTTEIPQINFPVVPPIPNFENALPIPPASAGVISPAEFPSRIQKVDLFVMDQHRAIQKLNETIKRLEDVMTSSTNARAGSLKDKIDSTKVTIKVLTNQYLQESEIYESMVKAAHEEMQKASQIITDRHNDLSLKVAQFEGRLNTLDGVVETRAEIKRVLERLLATKLALSESENREAKLTDEIIALNKSVQAVPQEMDANIASLRQIAASEKQRLTTNVLADIHKMLHSRAVSHSEILSKVNHANNKVANAFNEFENVGNEMLETMKSATQELQTSFSEVIDETSTETNEMYSSMNQRFDQFMTETESNFKSIFQEATDTVKTVKERCDDGNEALASAIQEEGETWEEDRKAVLAKYDRFEYIIAQECELQRGYMNDLITGINNTTSEFITTSFAEHEPLFKLSNSLDSIESRVQFLENALEETRSSAQQQLSSIGDVFDEIGRKIDSIKNEMVSKMDSLSSRMITKPKNPEGFALIHEVHALKQIHEDKLILYEEKAQEAHKILVSCKL